MTSSPIESNAGPLSDIHRGRLFVVSCISLISTAVAFAVVGAVMGPLKAQFNLSNQDVGWIGGAAIWGFTISIFILGPLCDVLGMKNLMRFAFLCHLAGPTLMMLASGPSAFVMLFVGALIVALGNGTVEAVCNPLVATIFPDQKTRKLNQFHMWFPGGILIGGVACFALDKIAPSVALIAGHSWQVKLALIMVPTVIYGLLLIGQKFPPTERVQSGISFGGMVKATFGRPLFLVLLLCMMITASLELGPGRWIPAVLEAGGIAGILVLAYINGLMAVLRFFAGAVIHRLSNTGILVCSAVLAGVGLLALSYAAPYGIVATFLAATVFAVGVCYFWPTMLGTAAERVPKGGALALSMLGGTGMLIVGVITSPQMGHVADKYLHNQLVAKVVVDGKEVDNQARTVEALTDVAATYSPLLSAPPKGVTKADLQTAIDKVKNVLADYGKNKALPEGSTAEALRAVEKNGPADGATAPLEAPAVKAKDTAVRILKAADNHGGLMSFRYVAPFSALIIVIFGILYLMDRAKGGYKAEKIGS